MAKVIIMKVNPNKDILRQKRLESLGVMFTRFDDLDVKKNIDFVFNELVHQIKELQPTPNPSKEGNN